MSDPLRDLAELPGLAQPLVQSRDAVDALLAHRALRRSFAAVSVECALRGAVAAASLAAAAGGYRGAALDLDDVRARTRAAGAEGVDLALDDTPTLAGALRISAEVGRLGPVWEHWPLQVLARLHVLAATGHTDPDELGRPRRHSVQPADAPVLQDALGPALHSVALAARLDALAHLLTTPTSAPALVVAAVVHGELLALRPFRTGNVLVALAAQRLVVTARGLDPRGVCIPEAGHAEQGIDAYARAAAAYASGRPAGVVEWVVHCVEAVRIGAREGIAICETLLRMG